MLTERFRLIGFNACESRRTPVRHAALRDDPAALALRLFRDQALLTDIELRELFADALVPAELIVDNTAAYRIDFAGDLYLLSDWPLTTDDEVLPAGETAAILFRAGRVFAGGGRTLDLCCGAGTLSLLLGASVGTDLNPRAIQLARFNARINGIENVEFRQGSLFEPVAAERFDLIVCQPPFVPRPAGFANHLFLHGGTRGDELAHAIIRRCGTHLKPGGHAILYSDWPLATGEELIDRIPCEGMAAHLFASPLITVESYCEAYGQHLTAHLRDLGIAGVRQCLTVLTEGEGTVQIEVLPHQWANIGDLVSTYFHS